MKKLRVLVLVHETLVPPETLAECTERQADEVRTEYDVVTRLRPEQILQVYFDAVRARRRRVAHDGRQ